MQHLVEHHDDKTVKQYRCIVENRSELMAACVVSYDQCKQFTAYGVYNIPCSIEYDDIIVELNQFQYRTQVYSRFLRLIKVKEEGVSLFKIKYNQLL